MKKSQLVIVFAFLAASLCLSACTATATPTPAPTAELPTLTATKAPPSTEWQLSPDGHIWYKESELYGGLFTINKEHPEYVEQYWEDTIRGLWNLNSVSQNKKFLAQFPTDDSLIEYLNNGGGPVEDLWIPAIYPSEARRFWYQATMEPTNEAVCLSQIAINIYKPTKDEIFGYSPSYATGSRYISFHGARGEVFVEIAQIEGKQILNLTFRQDLLSDSEVENEKGVYLSLALTNDKTSEDNLLAANQLLNSWIYKMNIPQVKSNGGFAWHDELTPPMLNILLQSPTPSQLAGMASIDSSPIFIR